MENNQNPSVPVRLVGDASTGSTGSTIGIGDLTVSKSGESILFMPRDASGNPQSITSIRSTDDVQVLQLVGATQAASFTLSLSGATTAPIPLQPIPPLTSFVWRATLPKAGSYDIGLSWGVFFGGPPGKVGATQALVEVFGSGSLIGSIRVDQSQVPDASSGIAVPNVGVFHPVGSFQFSGTDLQVRLSGNTNDGLLLASTLRVAPTGSTDPASVGFVDPNPYRASGTNAALEGAASTQSYGPWTMSSFYTPAGGWHTAFFAPPTGVAGTAFPNASDVQKALYGLSNVAAGSLVMSSPSPQSMVIQFTGPMGDQAWPTLGCSEPAIQVIHDGTAGSSIGGDSPSVTINGVPHALKAMSFAAGKPRMAFHLIQDAPAVQYLRFGEGLYQNAGPYTVQNGIGFGGRVAYYTQAGLEGIWSFQGLAGPALFQLDITWPGGDAAGDILECDVLDGTGATLASVTGIDQSKAPADSVDSAGVAWKSLGQFNVKQPVNGLSVQARGPGNAGKHVILDAIRLTRLSPDLGTKIQPGDDVRFHIPPDFVRTATGSVPASTGVPVMPAGATRLPAIPQVPKALKLGYNCDFPIYWSSESCYSNLAVQAQQPIGIAQNAAGNPTRLGYDIYLKCGVAASIISVQVNDGGGRGYGVPASGAGVWVLQWTSSPTSTCDLVPMSGATTVAEIAARRTAVGNVNRRYYQISTSDPSTPNIALRFYSTNARGDGTYDCDISNVAIYPPEINPDAPTKWRPGFLKQLRGAQGFRFMDLLGTNNMNLADFAHFPAQANFPLGYAKRSISVPIATIGPPTPDPFAEGGGGTVVRITTKIPHGLTTGFIVGLQTTDKTSLGQVTANLVDQTGASTTTPVKSFDPTDGYQGQVVQNPCSVIDATTLQVGLADYSGSLSRMTNTLNPATGVVYAEIAPNAMISPDDVADLTTVTGVEPWINVPWLATDDCVTRFAQSLAAQFPAGRTVHVEYGNEPWNWNFAGASYCARMNKPAGLVGSGYIPYYMTRMAQVHRIFQAVWTAAGRNPADIRRVCGVQQENAGGTTTPCLAYAIANGISFDELAPACYYSNTPACGPLDDLLTRDQLLDLFAMNVQQSDLPVSMASHTQACRDALAKNPAQTWLGNVVLVNYEGGPDTMTTPTMTANIASRNHGVHRHPDFCEIELNHLQMLEDAGVKMFNIFTLTGTRNVSQWGVYEGYQMEAGTGDATVDTANITDFENLPAIKSQTAAALMKWSAMVQGATPPARPVLRNGKALSYGGVAY